MSLSRGPPSRPTQDGVSPARVGSIGGSTQKQWMDPCKLRTAVEDLLPAPRCPLCWPPLAAGCWLGAGQPGRTLKTGDVRPLKMSYKRREQGISNSLFLGSCSHRPRAGYVDSQGTCRLSCCLANLGFSTALQCIAANPRDPGTGMESIQKLSGDLANRNNTTLLLLRSSDDLLPHRYPLYHCHPLSDVRPWL